MSRLLPLLAPLALLVPSPIATAQDGPNYELAERFDREYVQQRTYSSRVEPNWIGETDRFWYSYEDRFGWHYRLVDPEKARKDPLFDRDVLAAELSLATRQPLDAEHMRLSNAELDEEGRVFSFHHEDRKFEYDLVTGELTDRGELTDEDRSEGRSRRSRRWRRSFRDDDDEERTHRVFAPDDTAYVFARGHDLYYVEASDEVKEEIAAIEARLEAEEEEEAEEKDDKEQDEGSEGGDSGGDDSEEGDGGVQVETVRVKRHGEDDPIPVETDERRVWAEEVDESRALRLTSDGEEDYSFSGRSPGGRPGELGQDAEFEYDDYAWHLEFDAPNAPAEGAEGAPGLTRPGVRWAPDSSAFHVQRRDTRGVKELFLVNSIAEPRPELETYDYPMPGEARVRTSELHVFDRERRVLERIEPVWKDERYRALRWPGEDDGDDDEEEADEPEEIEGPVTLRFVRQDRPVRNLQYVSLDPRTGETTVLIEEGFEAANVSPQTPRYLAERDQFVWWSDRTGWGHFYLYDGEGNLLNAITGGKWRASRIVDVDEDKGLLFFRGNGREPDQNIYYEHLYRVHLDGSGLACLDPGDASHRSELSPTKSYLVDNCSRVDMPPTSILRDSKGNEILPLEEMDLSRLYEAGWTMPETFRVKAADGVTDLFGNMWKPFDFDPERSYPVIAEVYPGPQTEGVSHTFSSVNGRQQLAQVGFLVIQVGHRGGTPDRSKAYHSHGYFDLRDYGLEDKKVAIEQLAERHPYVDLNRVGLYGHSGGGFMTAAAMMVPPYNEFFDVGVSSAGNHDNNIYNNYWSERYHGLREVTVEEEGDGNRRGRGRVASPREEVRVDGKEERKEKDEKETRFEIRIPTTHELAANLKGNLLLVHGEIDNNVHPANTMRLVHALIEADKRFDLLIIPGARHGFGEANAYFTHKRWEFFAEHLLGDHQVGADIRIKE